MGAAVALVGRAGGEEVVAQVFWRERAFGEVLDAAGEELVAEFGDEGLSGPGAGFAEGADGLACDVICDAEESVGVLGDSAALEHTGGDFFHPEGAFAAGGALAAGFMGVELVDVGESPEHVAGVIHDDDAARAGHGACGGEAIEVHGNVFEADDAFG